MSWPFGGPSCFLQVSLVAERAIIAFLAESNPSQRKRLASGLSIHARNGIFRDRRSHIKSCLDELLDAQSGQASLIGTIALFPLPFLLGVGAALFGFYGWEDFARGPT